MAAGPGSIDQAHTEDEWIDLEELTDGVRFYREFLEGCASAELGIRVGSRNWEQSRPNESSFTHPNKLPACLLLDAIVCQLIYYLHPPFGSFLWAFSSRSQRLFGRLGENSAVFDGMRPPGSALGLLREPREHEVRQLLHMGMFKELGVRSNPCFEPPTAARFSASPP